MHTLMLTYRGDSEDSLQRYCTSSQRFIRHSANIYFYPPAIRSFTTYHTDSTTRHLNDHRGEGVSVAKEPDKNKKQDIYCSPTSILNTHPPGGI